jgi:serine/threonine-protein kinase
MAIVDAVLDDDASSEGVSLAGAKVGNYVLQQRIGSGGMGEVWRAEHPDIGRIVAIKILNADSANHKEAVERFFFEAKAANRTRHPNLIDIVDLGSLPATGQCYCVMEFLHGKDFSEVLRLRGRVEYNEALPWFLQILDGLQAVHNQGILHRDLKPENIFLTEDPHRGEVVKILDFGVAKLIRATGQGLTRVGVAMGTPMFMSPEQASGQKLDARSDLYAVGVLLYVALTGRYPFTGNTPTRILEKTVSEAPIPPRQVVPEMDAKVETLVLRCLEKDPAKRFSTAKEMAEAMSALKREREKTAEHPIVQGVGASGALGQLVAKPPERSSRRAAALGIIGGVSLLVALGLIVGGLLPLGGPPSEAAATTPAPSSLALVPPSVLPSPALQAVAPLSLVTTPEKAEVLRGEILLGAAPGPFLVEPGTILTVRAPGFQSLEVQAPPSGPLEVKLVPVEPASVPAPVAVPRDLPIAPKPVAKPAPKPAPKVAPKTTGKKVPVKAPSTKPPPKPSGKTPSKTTGKPGKKGPKSLGGLDG